VLTTHRTPCEPWLLASIATTMVSRRQAAHPVTLRRSARLAAAAAAAARRQAVPRRSGRLAVAATAPPGRRNSAGATVLGVHAPGRRAAPARVSDRRLRSRRGQASTPASTSAAAAASPPGRGRLHRASSRRRGVGTSASVGAAVDETVNYVPGPSSSDAAIWPIEFLDLTSSPDSAKVSAISAAKAAPAAAVPPTTGEHVPDTSAHSARPARKRLSVAGPAAASSSGRSGYRRKRATSPPMQYKQDEDEVLG